MQLGTRGIYSLCRGKWGHCNSITARCSSTAAVRLFAGRSICQYNQTDLSELRNWQYSQKSMICCCLGLSRPAHQFLCPAPRVALSNDARLTSVCRVHRAYVENREAYRKTKIGTEVAHVTRDSDTTFKVKRSKVNLQGARAYCGGLPHSLCYCVTLATAGVVQCLYVSPSHVFYRRG